MNTARAIERSVDKFWTTGLLEQAGLPVPETRTCEAPDAAMEAFRELGGDVIVKPLFGSMGLGMVRVTDEDLAWRVFRTIERIQGVYYLQRMVPHEGRDVRAFVVGQRILGAIERRAPGWRTNVSRGGAASADRAARRSCGARAPGRRLDRGRVRRGRPAHRQRRHDVRSRGERHPRLGGTAAGHRTRRRRRHRGAGRDGRAGPRGAMTPADVASAVQLACLLEVSAPKPGNVSPGRAFDDMRYEDFLASAVAIGPAFLDADRQALGATILAAVEATRRWTAANTNLGIILLLAPLAARHAPEGRRITARRRARGTSRNHGR